ncbi:MAG: BatD family protein [Colwellia sp.]|nr:BatD family protein [Colwellia sp.]
MVKIILKLVAISFLVVSSSLSNYAFALSKVTTSIDTNPVMSNESIVLTVTADDSVERDALDTSPLATNFIVARTEVSSQTSMVNFKTSRTTRWQIVLIPRKTGKLTIPELTIDGHHSQAISVNVIEQGSQSATKQQDIFISTELSANDVYVQQLVTLTVKLHVGVQLQRGSLSEPTLDGATIVQIGKDQESDGIINGKRYRIIERTYAITPEQSGELTLDSPMFSGEVMVQSRRRSGFLSFGETKPVNVLGKKLSLNVRPIPDSYSTGDNWLPSELLTLHQEWQPSSSEFKVGEPITRTITLTASGLAKAQLPNIIMTAPTGIKVYPDQAELHSNLSKERLVSQKKQNFALVASQAGDYILPKITIAWWNTVTNKYQQAVLPEQTITVLPNPDSKQVSTLNEDNLSQSPNNTLVPSTPLTTTEQPIIIQQASALQWLFLALWLLTLMAWLIHVIVLKRGSIKKPKPSSQASVNNKYLALMAACKQNNAEQVLSLLVPWVNSLVPQGSTEISTLSEAITLIDNEAFTTAIDNVQRYLYGNKTTDKAWQGKSLLAVVQSINHAGIKYDDSIKFTLNPS